MKPVIRWMAFLMAQLLAVVEEGGVGIAQDGGGGEVCVVFAVAFITASEQISTHDVNNKVMKF